MPIVQMEDGTELEFPESMTREDMRSAILSKYPNASKSSGAPEPTETEKATKSLAETRELIRSTRQLQRDLGLAAHPSLEAATLGMTEAMREPVISPESATKAAAALISRIPVGARGFTGKTLGPSTVGSPQRGLEEFIGENVAGLTTPTTAGAIALTPVAPEVMLPLFAKQSFESIPEHVAQAVEGETPAEKIKGGLGVAMDALITTGTARGGVKAIKGIPNLSAEALDALVNRTTDTIPVMPPQAVVPAAARLPLTLAEAQDIAARSRLSPQGEGPNILPPPPTGLAPRLVIPTQVQAERDRRAAYVAEQKALLELQSVSGETMNRLEQEAKAPENVTAEKVAAAGAPATAEALKETEAVKPAEVKPTAPVPTAETSLPIGKEKVAPTLEDLQISGGPKDEFAQYSLSKPNGTVIHVNDKERWVLEDRTTSNGTRQQTWLLHEKVGDKWEPVNGGQVLVSQKADGTITVSGDHGQLLRDTYTDSSGVRHSNPTVESTPQPSPEPPKEAAPSEAEYTRPSTFPTRYASPKMIERLRQDPTLIIQDNADGTITVTGVKQPTPIAETGKKETQAEFEARSKANTQAMEDEFRAKAQRDVGDNPKRLEKELREAKQLLTNEARKQFGKGQMDLANNQFVSDDGKLALIWRNTGKTNRGSVGLFELKEPAKATPPPAKAQAEVTRVAKTEGGITVPTIPKADPQSQWLSLFGELKSNEKASPAEQLVTQFTNAIKQKLASRFLDKSEISGDKAKQIVIEGQKIAREKAEQLASRFEKEANDLLNSKADKFKELGVSESEIKGWREMIGKFRSMIADTLTGAYQPTFEPTTLKASVGAARLHLSLLENMMGALGPARSDAVGILRRIYGIKEDIGATKTQAQAPKLLTEKPQQPAPPPAATEGGELKSMGGALLGEFEGGAGTPTSIKNAKVDAERAQRGLPPMIAPLKRAFGDVWDAAMAEIDRDPGVQDRLIAELSEKPRALTDREDALLLHRRVDLRNEFGRATRDLAQAYDDGRTSDIPDLMNRVAMWSDKLQELENVTKSSGTETGRGLAARKMMANEDFTLAKMVMDKRAANGGRPLSADETLQIQKIHDEYQAKLKALEEHNAETQQKLAASESARVLAEMKAQAAQQPTYAPSVLAQAERFATYMDKKGDAALARLKARLARTSAGVDPLILSDAAIYAAAKITRGVVDSAKWIADLGEWSRDHIAEIKAAAEKILADEQALLERTQGKATAANVKKVITEIPARIDDAKAKIAAKVSGGKTGEIGTDVRKLVRALVEQNPAITRDELIDTVHGVLKESSPDTTRLEAMDAISGRGKFWLPSQDAVSKKVRDLATQIRLVGHQIDVEAKRPLPRTGYQPEKLSDTARREQQKLNELKRRFGVVVTNAQTQLASALAARKTYYTHRLSDLKNEIATRTRIAKTPSTVTDPQLEALKAEYVKVKEEHQKIFGTEMDAAAKLKAATSAAERNLKEWEARLENAKKGVFGPTEAKKSAITSPEITALKSRTEALREEVKELHDLANPKKTPAERALQARKTAMARQLADLAERLAKGDFSKRAPRAPIALDDEGIRLQGQLERARSDWEEGLRQDQLANRSRWQKGLDAFVRWERAFKLSSPIVFGKLTASAITRAVTTATEEATGAAMGVLPGISQVAEQAPREGGINVRGMAKGVVAGFTQGMKDAWQTARRGASDLDVAYGGKLLDKDWANFFGQLHGMMKAPIKRAEFTLALEKRTEFAIKNGEDVTQPIVQQRLAAEALDDAYRTIFMQRGFSSDMFNQFVGMMEKSKKYQPVGEVNARMMRFLLPIVRVPMNIVAETATGIYGVPAASARTMIHAVKGTLDSLPPETADSIMRQFKKGSIGLGLVAIGYFSPQSIGGYDWREKRAAGAVKTGGFQVGGTDIPRWMTHAPWFELMQFGATIRHVQEQHVKGQEKGIPEGVWAASTGLVDETPFIGEMMRLSGIFKSTQERDYALGELAKGTLVPQIVNWIAQITDEAEKRKPKTILQHVESGIPGLREQVPTR